MFDEFTISITTPSGIDVRVPGITNREYLNIIKFCGSKDYEALEQIFEKHIFSKIPQKLNCIDKFYILIVVKIFFIDEEITVLSSDGKQIDISLFTVLNKLDDIEITDTYTYSTDNIKFELGIPERLFYKNIDDYFDSIIKTITIKNKTAINYKKLSTEDKQAIFNNLPHESISILKNHLKFITDHYKNFTIIEENESFLVDKVDIDLLSSSLINVICSIYGLSLINFFESLYVFVNKMSADSNLFYSMTPLDSKTMIEILNQDIKRQNEALKNEEQY